MKTKTTNLENALLRNIADSEYHDGQHPVGHAVWSGISYLDGNGITARNISGVMSSLVKKGLVHVADYDVGMVTVTMTQEGFDAMTNHHTTSETSNTKEKTMTKKNTINAVAAESFESRIAKSGLPVELKAGWTKVSGAEGRRLYVARTKKVGRIDCVGLQGEGLVELKKPNGKVTHRVDFGQDAEKVLTTFEKLLELLQTLPPVEAKATKAPAEKPTETNEKDETKKAKAIAPQVTVGRQPPPVVIAPELLAQRFRFGDGERAFTVAAEMEPAPKASKKRSSKK